MPLSIFVPADARPLTELFDGLKCLELHGKIAVSPPRSILFYEELVVGFIVHTSAVDSKKPPAKTVYLKAETGNSSYSTSEAGESRLLDSIQDDSAVLEVFSAVVQDSISDKLELEDGPVHVTIWKFEAPVGYPKQEVGGSICFQAALLDGHLPSPIPREKNGKSDEPADLLQGSMLPENLFDGLNFHILPLPQKRMMFLPRMAQVSTPGTSTPEIDSECTTSKSEELQSKENAFLTLPTSLPLILRLRSTKPGGRNDVLLTTLSIEASSELLNFAAQKNSRKQFYFNIISLDPVFKSGVISQMGDMTFPLRCALTDVINITYKLVNNDYLDTQMKNATGSSPTTLRLLQLSMRVQVQKYDPVSDTYTNACNEISTLWSPVLEFGHLAPPISNSMKSVANTAQFQVQSQFNSLPAIVKHTSSLLRKSVMVNNVVGVSKSRLALAPPRVTSPVPGRLPLSASSSPLLSVSRSAVFPTKKLQKSTLALPVSSSAVTVNLSANPNASLSGLLLTFKGNVSVELGKIVTWKIQAINQSSRTLSLSLIVKNSRKRNSLYLQANSSSGVGQFASTPNILASGFDDSSNDFPIFSKLQLHSQYNLLKLNGGGVVILTNDVRLGPLEPNLVFESELQLIGISKGISNLEGLRVVDFTSGDCIDFGKLVEVFVMLPEPGS